MKSILYREAVRLAYDRRDSHPMRGRGFTVFSFMVEKNKILGMGVNNRDVPIPLYYGYQRREKGWGKTFNVCEHAELNAWRKCRGLVVKNFELINVRITDGKNLAMSCPCECCQEWLRENGCTSVYFTTGAAWAKISLT